MRALCDADEPKERKTMSIENVTYAFQNAATTGVGLTQFFLEPRFTDSAGSRDATDVVHAYVVVRSMAMYRDQHKVVDCSVVEQSAADNLATIVNGGGEQGIQVPVGASRKECG